MTDYSHLSNKHYYKYIYSEPTEKCKTPYNEIKATVQCKKEIIR